MPIQGRELSVQKSVPWNYLVLTSGGWSQAGLLVKRAHDGCGERNIGPLNGTWGRWIHHRLFNSWLRHRISGGDAERIRYIVDYLLAVWFQQP
ncbi:hypothetical protein BT96DRAFT_477657 [Gymnopus androsaceus JB14]|uniref:Uncharacterized protein n=1 Tax=Gymnopus androsaceus JB14 TaxID=1447944 RepID=A0A6A4GPE2_9AGAR|nr:hypothetical protein BT96DRAFT_477657 [Gymnopus androsaceus JB14]